MTSPSESESSGSIMATPSSPSVVTSSSQRLRHPPSLLLLRMFLSLSAVNHGRQLNAAVAAMSLLSANAPAAAAFVHTSATHQNAFAFSRQQGGCSAAPPASAPFAASARRKNRRRCPSPSSSSYASSSSRLHYKDGRTNDDDFGGEEGWVPPPDGNENNDKKKKTKANSNSSGSKANTRANKFSSNKNRDDDVARARVDNKQAAAIRPASKSESSVVRRADVVGVSVSDVGFLILLTAAHDLDFDFEQEHAAARRRREASASSTSKSVVLPLRLTTPQGTTPNPNQGYESTQDDDDDVQSVSSPEALTILQLLSGIDMAGAVMHPAALQHAVALWCSEDDEDDQYGESDDDGSGGDVDEDNKNDGEGGIITVEDELGLAPPSQAGSVAAGGDTDNERSTDDAANNNSDSNSNKASREAVRKFINQSLKPGMQFSESGASARANAIFPRMSLDAVRIALPEVFPGTVDVGPDDEDGHGGGSMGVSSSSGVGVGGVVSPVPLKFVLDVTVVVSDDTSSTSSSKVRLSIPLYSEINSIDYADILAHGDPTVRSDMDKSEAILDDVCLTHDPDGSASFLAVALALRYKAPVVIGSEVLDWLVGVERQRRRRQAAVSEDGSSSATSDLVDVDPTGFAGGGAVCILGGTGTDDADAAADTNENKDDTAAAAATTLDRVISQTLPHWKSLTDLRSTSRRVSQNIERSYEVHKLQGALRIATERGDLAAMERIRVELDKFDSFDDLPTTEKGGDDGGSGN